MGAKAMATECPINTVDEHAARIVASIAVVLAAFSLWEPARFLIALLAIDFTLRGFVSRRYSPLRFVAKSITGALGWEPKPVYAPPKRFAAQIGATLTIAATVLHVAGLHVAALVVTTLLIVAASLEAGLGICLACWIYPYVFRLRGQQA
jgi:hypothetical protein